MTNNPPITTKRTITSNRHLLNTKKPMPYDIGNTGPGFGQTLKWAGFSRLSI